VSLATERILIDTGPLVALFDRNDPYHKPCADQARHLGEGVFTCWPVITEACYLLRHRLDLVAELLEACHDGIYELLPLEPRDIPEIGGTLQKFSDQ
jgi:predicted nucleic acid-binding protein